MRQIHFALNTYIINTNPNKYKSQINIGIDYYYGISYSK